MKRLAAAAILALTLAGCGGSVSCPRGQHWGVLYYYPVTVGKVVTFQPVWACVP